MGLYGDSTVKQIFVEYHKTYKPIFRHYTIEDGKKDIGTDLKNEGLQLPQFLKFTSQYGRELDLSKEELQVVFRQVIKDRDQEGKANELNYMEYQKALLRIYLLYSSTDSSNQKQQALSLNFHLRNIDSIKAFKT